MLSLCLSSQEYQSCNTLPCPDLKKTTPWTPWTPVNISDNGGHYEQRFRYTCKARIPDPSLLEVGRQRIEMRYCSSDGSTGCSTDGECRVEKTWSVSSYLSLWMCLCYLTPTGFLRFRRLVIGLLASSHRFCLLFIRSFFLTFSNFSSLSIYLSCKSERRSFINQLSCLPPRAPRLYQQIKASGVLMNFQSTKPISS